MNSPIDTDAPAVRPLAAVTDTERRVFAWLAQDDIDKECARREAAGLPALPPDEAQNLRVQAQARYAADRLENQRRLWAAVLFRAHELLRQTWPDHTGELTFGGTRYAWRFDLPGVLRVFDVAAGDCVAASLPGQPGELAPIPVQASGAPA